MQTFLSMADNRAVDDYAIQTCGIPGESLMAAAGKAVVEKMLEKRLVEPRSNILILTGKGNNGGDGYVIASDLLSKGYQVSVLSVVTPENVEGDARLHLDILMEKQPQFMVWDRSPAQKKCFSEATLIIDALLGTGVKGTLKPPYSELIELANRSAASKVAVDVPSGATGDLGDILQPCLKAALTVSMGYGKQGCLFEPARSHTGEIIPVQIGFPEDSLKHIHGPVLQRLESTDFDPDRFTRSSDTHKYQSGKVYILGGSRGFSGAAILAARGALRSGAGLVRLAVPESIGAIAETASLETIVDYLPETDSQSAAMAGLDQVLSGASWSDVTALGPGLGRHPNTIELVLELIAKIERPLVIDADALYALSTNPDLLKDRVSPTILTPHAGEFKRLAGMEGQTTPTWQHARKMAQEFGVYVLLKGAPSLLATPDGQIFINSTGNPGMATGGSGDVLTGVLASLWSQWSILPDILNFGMLIHGLAADHQMTTKGILGLNADDIVEGLPQVLKEYGGLPH
jgi:hydroxyethylthiazole kinase-like uncharacterized protein yjeF